MGNISRGIALSVAVLLLLTVSVDAASLNLTLTHYPRTYSGVVTVTYDANAVSETVGTLTASGTSSQIFYDASPNYVQVWGTFSVEVDIDHGTKDFVSGSGTLIVDDDFFGQGQLFSSTAITAFGFSGNDILEFLFIQDGNMLAPDGAEVGIILPAVSIPDGLWGEGNLPTFTEDFANTGTGYSNTFYLPEPSICILLALGGLTALRRRHVRATRTR